MRTAFSLLIFLIFIGHPIDSTGQSAKPGLSAPRVFIIGEEEKKYESIIQQHSVMLFQVCNNSMEDAYDHWNNVLREMEIHSQKMGFDLKGIKIWLNVFWNTDGSIDYIVYHPKPNSKNMNYTELTQFFNSFLSQYALPIKTSKKFSHYGSASFPLFNKGNLMQEK